MLSVSLCKGAKPNEHNEGKSKRTPMSPHWGMTRYKNRSTEKNERHFLHLKVLFIIDDMGIVWFLSQARAPEGKDQDHLLGVKLWQYLNYTILMARVMQKIIDNVLIEQKVMRPKPTQPDLNLCPHVKSTFPYSTLNLVFLPSSPSTSSLLSTCTHMKSSRGKQTNKLPIN